MNTVSRNSIKGSEVIVIKLADQRKTILLVEDDRSVSLMLKMLLETRGYLVETAYSAQETFLHISKHIDLILLDVLLPDQDGYNICRELKRSQASSHIPIIMLSAKALSQDIIEGLYLGADDYLVKPFEYDELVTRMEVILRRENVPSNYRDDEKVEEDVILELRYIVDGGLVAPVFQPIYNLEDFSIFGLEALCRLTLKHSAISNPEVLFNLALRFGLYEELEMIVWKKAMEKAEQHLQNEKLFLNCNPYLLEGDRFAEIKTMFEKNSLKNENIILEITEKAAISEYEVFYKQLAKFREIGFKFAVDDVGGGYACLESIVETKPEVVKIDRHVIVDIDKDPFKRSIVKFIVSFCRENNVISIAEGIETKEALETVKQLGVHAAQGFYLHKPTPTINIPEMLQAVKNIQP
jgi:EAL domain-containing protein (putative c-di-GMP-specific phosphodiesterase class I)/CheY-like chemotaxis protein